MRREDLLERLAGLRRANVGGVRAPHKPLLLLWLFGRLTATGSSAVTYEEAEEPVSLLINEFGPPVASPSAARQRAAMPFVHLERELWELRDGTGAEIGPDAPERRGWLLDRATTGRLRPPVERLMGTPSTMAAAVRVLLDRHFTPALAELICTAVGLDLAALDPTVAAPTSGGRGRKAGFAEQVLRAYAYACAMCGFDGALGRNPVGLQAAHVRWHSQEGPDEIDNALALCALHHALFDLGVLGLTSELRIRVSELYVARSDAGQAVHALSGRRLTAPQPGRPALAADHVAWHTRQVFKGHPAAA
ncbi:phosphorothioated DNA-binding restriction endonuclease [Actinoallomurus sp. NPDC050550]|uniref:phosphorothioated DNA-binding restriction endonuclease n=1 Tax=Actinoallomurus sp. NPDC050550 TaxID=3154937 RepID=UPI003407A81F